MEQKILINLRSCLLHLRDGDFSKTYPVAVGTNKTPSPVGEFTIVEKARWGGAFGTRWMRLSVPWGIYGIHGTNRPDSIGKRASHGCIRLHNRHVEEIYEHIEVGNGVVMTGIITPELLVCGSRGNLVQLVQQKLQEHGYFAGTCNGIFDDLTEKAVLTFQKNHSLSMTGQIAPNNLHHLGIQLTSG